MRESTTNQLKVTQLHGAPPSPVTTRTRRIAVALVVCVLVQLVLLTFTVLSPERLARLINVESLQHHSWSVGFQVIGLLLSAVAFWRVALMARYRVVGDVGDARLPHLTVLVPAYNEGRQVLSTLRSLAASQYPAQKLEIIAIDDGSQDDTWSWIRRGEAELPNLVTAVRCARNGGKKHALAHGVRRARGEVIVTVDSDSEVLPDTLRLLVAPLVVDPDCGAVAGNVRVLNRHAGALPRMLDACFTTSFDFGRAGESMVGGVMCCPGALSAWRSTIFKSSLDEWLEQTFFGQPAMIGEDRALTNLVLRTGSTVRYQSNAIVLTQVPTTARQLCKMFVRWGRSNVRESIVMAAFVFGLRDSQGKRRVALQMLYLASVLGTLASALLFVPSLVALALQPVLLPLFAGLTLASAVPAMVVTLAVRDRRTAMWAIPWGIYSTLVTAWIPLWSLLTMHRSGWLTRTPTTVLRPVVQPERVAEIEVHAA